MTSMAAVRRVRLNLPLATTAAAVFALVCVRAAVQSITIDEADSYLVWVARSAPAEWQPASNNHVLNSLLIRLSTTAFGISHLSVRAPALLGAALYIGAACVLAGLVARMRPLQWAVLVCLICNPLVLDYLVAARGYSLAMGLLLSGLAVIFRHVRRRAPEPRASYRACALLSAFLALSFAASFAFGIVNVLTAIAAFLWLRERSRRDPPAPANAPPVRTVSLFASCVVPGLLISLVLSASVVLRFPKEQLWFGSRSIPEMFSSVQDASLYRLNPHIVNPLLYPALDSLKHALFPLLVAMLICQAGIIAAGRRDLSGRRARLSLRFAAVLACLSLATVLIHWSAFRFLGVLLPKERTALYLAPLITLLAAALANVEVPCIVGVVIRRGLITALCLFACHFLLCLRLTYFREWYWNADTQAVYEAVRDQCRKHGIRDVVVNWKCAGALNFYRRKCADRDMDEFVSGNDLPPGKRLYVLDYPFESSVIERERLTVVYRGELSDIAVAVRLDQEGEACGKAGLHPAPGRPGPACGADAAHSGSSGSHRSAPPTRAGAEAHPAKSNRPSPT